MAIRQSLDIWLDGADRPVGRLDALDSGSMEFRYEEPAFKSGRALSLSLPLSEEPTGDVVTRAFFDNLLPENDLMQRTIDREGLDRGDIVGILAHVGADCPGAISCLPQGSDPIKVPGDLGADYMPLSTEEIVEIAQRLQDQKPLPDEIKDPSPVAGVQPKVALTVLDGDVWALPARGRKVPTTHILKVPRRAEASEAKQEDAACKLASACDFEVSFSLHTEIEDVDALLIQRFDRTVEGGVVYRVHQEDFAQALGLPGGLKYQRNGTPERCFSAGAVRSVLDEMDNPAKAIETFLLATFFNLAIGNNDNHAKNHGILHGADGSLVLTPLYDLLPIQLHEKYTDELAFQIGDAKRSEDLVPADINAFLAIFGLAGNRARRFIEGPVFEMLQTIEERSGLLPSLGLKTFDDLIGREISHLSQILGLGLNIRGRDYVASSGGGWLAGS